MVKGKSTTEAVPEVNQNEELAALRAKVAFYEEEKAAAVAAGNPGDKALAELQALKRSQNQGLNQIQYTEMKVPEVCLWHVSGHNIGKRVGPIHPAVAEDTFLMFAGKGIKLSMNKPTPEFIEAYKKTPDYKKAADKEATRRAGKDKKKGGSQIERLAELIAKDRGISVDQLNTGLKDRSEVLK